MKWDGRSAGRLHVRPALIGISEPKNFDPTSNSTCPDYVLVSAAAIIGERHATDSQDRAPALRRPLGFVLFWVASEADAEVCR